VDVDDAIPVYRLGHLAMCSLPLMAGKGQENFHNFMGLTSSQQHGHWAVKWNFQEHRKPHGPSRYCSLAF